MEIGSDENKINKNFVFYDLETNGLDYYTTGILQFTILDSNGNIIMNKYVYPFNNKIEGTNIHGIDLEKLKQNNAISTVELLIQLKKELRKRYHRDDIYFVAYNNFGYDQIILENNFKINNIKMPLNWYFVDLFPIVKEYINYKNVHNFKLKTIFEYLFGTDLQINFHCALADTTCLYKIFNHFKNETTFPFFIGKYSRSLLHSDNIFNFPISAINGYTNGMIFQQKNIHTIGDLYNLYKNMKYDKSFLDYYLQYNVNIYSDYYRKNIIKQIGAIHYLQ